MKYVDPNLYDEDYFLKACGGYDYFAKYKGRVLDPRLKKAFQLGKIEKKMNVLDFGCGRGELVLQSALKGANVIGIDYSETAIKISRQITRGFKNIKLICGEINELDKIKKQFDTIFLIDVVEHMANEQLIKLIKKLKEKLKSEGRIVIHTSPTKNFKYAYKFIYLCNKLFKPSLKFRLQFDKYEKQVHINEQTLSSLKKLARQAGLRYKIWLENTEIAQDFARPNIPLIFFIKNRSFFMNDLYAIYKKV